MATAADLVRAHWALPRPALKAAAAITAMLLPLIVVVAVWAGATAALALSMGALAGLAPALALPRTQALALALPAAMTGAVAVAVAGQAFPAGCFVALTCLLVAPANVIRNGLLAGIPTSAAVLATYSSGLDPVVTAGLMLAGGLLIVVLFGRFRQPSNLVGITTRSAAVHAVATASAVGLAVLVVTHFEVPHGYWIPMTITIVLRPYGAETRRVARDRVLGTVGGAVLASRSRC